ncbi:hypothetical protein MRB53_039616 [Persea americana]|nr:hypothetical protein MRB53_039616 [Persea americana]
MLATSSLKILPIRSTSVMMPIENERGTDADGFCGQDWRRVRSKCGRQSRADLGLILLQQCHLREFRVRCLAEDLAKLSASSRHTTVRNQHAVATRDAMEQRHSSPVRKTPRWRPSSSRPHSAPAIVAALARPMQSDRPWRSSQPRRPNPATSSSGASVSPLISGLGRRALGRCELLLHENSLNTANPALYLRDAALLRPYQDKVEG